MFSSAIKKAARGGYGCETFCFWLHQMSARIPTLFSKRLIFSLNGDSINTTPTG
jgi:hypothetical protein